jgi:sensor histidine kinase YesM
MFDIWKKNKMKSLSFELKIMFSIVTFTILPLFIIMLISLNFYIISIKTKNDIELERQLERFSTMLDRELLNYIDKTNIVTNSKILIDGLRKDFTNDLSGMIYFYDTIDVFFRGLASSNTAESKINIYTTNDSLYQSRYMLNIDKFNDKDIISKLKEDPNRILWKNNAENQYAKNITLYKTLISNNNNFSFLSMEVSFSFFLKIYENAGISNSVAIVCYDNNGNTFFNNTDSLAIDKITYQKTLVSDLNIKGGYFREHELYNVWKTIIGFLVIFILIALFILYVSKVVSKSITKEFNNFIKIIRNSDELIENPDLIEVSNNNDDVNTVKMKFKYLTIKLKEEHINRSKNIIQKEKLESELLQAKINPHFLYNTLSNIKWSVLRNTDKSVIIGIIDAMIHYYRLVLNKGSNIITLGDEIEMLIEHSNIYKKSRNLNFDLIINMPEELKGYKIVKMLLQPAFENAIIHGINGIDGVGLIKIDVSKEENMLKIIISDNGFSIPKDKLKDIFSAKSVNSYGLHNTIKRIKMYYGDNSGVEINSEKGVGTQVVFLIEALSEDDLQKRINIEI